MFEILGGPFLKLRVFVVVYEHVKCEHESDEISTWVKLDGCTYKQCPFMCKSTVKDFVVVHM